MLGGSGSFARCGVSHAPAWEPLSLGQNKSATQQRTKAGTSRLVRCPLCFVLTVGWARMSLFAIRRCGARLAGFLAPPSRRFRKGAPGEQLHDRRIDRPLEARGADD